MRVHLLLPGLEAAGAIYRWHSLDSFLFVLSSPVRALGKAIRLSFLVCRPQGRQGTLGRGQAFLGLEK